jgi:hypothetical protein
VRRDRRRRGWAGWLASWVGERGRADVWGPLASG